MTEIPVFMAFGAGLISFLSPCVLPLVPGYVSFISGVPLAVGQISEGAVSLAGAQRRSVIISSLLFVSGFSLVFIALGASATWIGTLLSSKLGVATKLAGSVILIFGLIKLGLVHPKFLYREARFEIKNRRFGYFGAALIGAAFAFGWTPCIGPVLAAILTYAGMIDTTGRGIFLLFVYSLGLGVPFIATAIGINQFFKWFARLKRYAGVIEKVSGLVMVTIGLMILTNTLTLIPRYFTFLNSFSL